MKITNNDLKTSMFTAICLVVPFGIPILLVTILIRKIFKKL